MNEQKISNVYSRDQEYAQRAVGYNLIQNVDGKIEISLGKGEVPFSVKEA